MSDRLRSLWDFEDLDTSERRLREQLERERSDAGRAEVLTQLARIEGLRGNFDASAATLDQAEPLGRDSEVANIRLELERGRLFRSSGDHEAALPLFTSAFERATDAGEHFLAGDAAHMAAVATRNRDEMEHWTRRGLDLAAREPEAAYWAGPLLNNLAWTYYDSGEYERALELFEQALAARLRDPENEAGIAWARYGVAQALRALERVDEAEDVMAPALGWARREGKPDDYFSG